MLIYILFGLLSYLFCFYIFPYTEKRHKTLGNFLMTLVVWPVMIFVTGFVLLVESIAYIFGGRV